MLEVTRAHLERWASERHGLALERFRDLTFEIMARLVLGVDAGLDLARLRQLNDELARGAIFFPRVDVPFTPYGKALRALDELKRQLRGVVRARRDTPSTDALGRLIAARDESGAALSEDELVEQCVILTFAGHETTASMLASLALALRDHPPWEARLRDEQHRVRGEAPLALAHLDELDLLDATLKEIERMWPPISMCQRGVLEPIEFQGYTLDPGTTVSYSPWASHRIAEIFADPDRFDPERFLAPRREHRAAPHAPYALVGFGGGARLCIGQAFALLEAKIVASLVLSEYALRVEAGDPRLKYVPTLHPESGLPATLLRGPSAT
ncbi:MAG: cytochrome P450 [Deltaproteobacteria bacterium]|nr:cytochrome P450 [Deltaproteobacteria bacterium]